MDYDATEQLNDLARQPQEPPKPAPKWNGWSAPLRAIPAAVAEVGAAVGESLKAFGQALDSTGTASAGGMFSVQSEAERRQSDKTRQQIKTTGMTGDSEATRSLRNVADYYAPDPATSSKAEQVVFGLTKGVGKAVGYGLATGPAAPFLFGIDEGLAQTDQLQRQGANSLAAQRAGMVAGAVNTAGFAIPVAGSTIGRTAALATLSGPASFILQQSATREILRDANYQQIGEQFDPLDPWGLAVSMLPFGFGAWAARSRIRLGKADGVHTAGTGDARAADAGRSDGGASLQRDNGALAADARAADAQGVASGEPVGRGPGRPADAVMPQAAQEHVDAAMVHNLTMAADAEVHNTVRPMESLAEFAARTLPEDAPAVRDSAPDPFLAWIKRNGGVNFADKFDITGEASGVRLNRGGIFKKDGRGLDDLAVIAEAEGWLPPGATKDIDGGVPQLRDMLKRSMDGERIMRLEDQYNELAQRTYASDQEQRAAHLENRLRMLGVDPAPARGNADVMQAYLDQHEHRLIGSAMTEIAAQNAPMPDVQAPEWAQQRDAVAATFEPQIKATGRYSEQEATAYARMLGSYYATMASRLGMTANMLAAKYPLRISGEAQVSGGASGVLNQFAGVNAKTYNVNELTNARRRLAMGDDPETVRKDTGWSAGPDGKWRFEISDADAKLKPAIDGLNGESAPVPLGQVLDHPALFAAYPRLADVMVSVRGSSNGGSFTVLPDGQFTIRIGRADQLSTLLHEIQHGIQTIEGFAFGGMPEQFSGLTASAQAELDGLNAKLRAGDYDMSEYQGLMKRKRDIMNSADPNSGVSTYRRLAGEVEARNTQARAKMTDAERAATPPSRTADVAESDVIITFNGKEMAQAPMPANAVDPRGQIQIGKNLSEVPSVISIFGKADRSTMLHESGHFFIEVQADMARQIADSIRAGEVVSAGERGILDDIGRLLDWAGIKGEGEQSALDRWLGMSLEERRAMHEDFAKAFEAYAMEGKAPSAELAGIFQRFKDWLLAIYRDASTLGIKLSDDVRGAFDRMLATDEQIARVGEQTADVPTTQELGAQARQAGGAQDAPQGQVSGGAAEPASAGGGGDPLIQSIRARADQVVADAPDMVVVPGEDGRNPITARELLEQIRREAAEGTETELGGQDAPLLDVAIRCALSQGE